MSGDILHNKPARPSTVIPGHWLINLPPDTPIYIQRYRSTDTTGDSREQALLEDALEVQWRKINSTGEGSVKDVLAGGCATIVDSAKGTTEHEREFWIFSTTGPNTEESASLERILPDFAPITPAELLECSRHGSDISCLSQPSTSQRPTISCDVHFEPRGEERVAWERLGLAILEKAEWKRGKRVIARTADVQLLPDLNGLMLKFRPRKKFTTRPPKASARIQVIQPLGIPAMPIGPYRPTAREASTLAASFESALGPTWLNGQSAYRLDAQLQGRTYWEYTTLWIPKSATTVHNAPSFDADWKKDQGILAVWPTHVLEDISGSTRRPVQIRTVRDMPILESSVDLLGIASGLFDAISTYREPVDQLTPPGDTSFGDPNLAGPDISESSPTYPWRDTHDSNGDINGHDDLEDLFASPSSHQSTTQHFEMFGDDDDRRNSMPMDNSHLIDYDDVVMTSPPPFDRRESLREVMGDVDEAGPGLITDDDFNFFDSPPDPDAVVVVPEPAPTILMPTPESLSHTVPAEATPAPDIPTVEKVTSPEPPSPVVEPPPAVVAEATPDSPLIASPVSHELPVLKKSPKRRRTRADDLIPLEFSPLDLAHLRSTYVYNQVPPMYIHSKLNLDLIERLRGPYKKEKKHDYTLAWRLDASDIESDIEEYTRPPTPVSEYDETVTPPTGPSPSPLGQQDDSEGQVKYNYQGQWCVAAGLHALLSRVTRPDHMFVPWQASWGDDAPADILESPVTLPRKRISGPRDNSSLTKFAKQIIQNRHARQTSRFTRGEAYDGDGLAEEGVTLSDLSNPESMPLALPSCSIHTGFQGNVIQLSGAALRYWSELGLQPLSGPKNLKAVIVTSHGEDEGRARRLADSVRAVYSSLNLGAMEVDTTFGREGFQSFGDKAPLPDWNHDQDDSSVMLVFARNNHPSHSALLEHLPDTKPNQAIYIVPLSLDTRDIPDTAYEIYNSISRQVHPVHPTEEAAPWHNYPTFTLAPTERPKPRLTMAIDWPVRSFDVFGSWRWIHAAYTYDEGADTLTLFVMDAEGDDWDVKVETGLGDEWRSRVNTMWDWIHTFGESAAIEWRVSICSLGIMEPAEMKAWRSIFIDKAQPITVMMCDPSASTDNIPKPKAGPANVPQGMLTDPSTTILDESQFGTYLPLTQRQPIALGDDVIYSASSFLLSLSSSILDFKTSTYHVIWHRPSPGKEEDDVDQELAGEMYRLACWGGMRFGLEGLPAPLAAVGAVKEALSVGPDE